MRRTIKRAIDFQGPGIHSGQEAHIRLHPSESGGIRFRLGGALIPAHISFKTGDRRGTTLGREGTAVQTVEHLLAAFYGMEVTDCLVEFLSGTELPILDGSALDFARALHEESRVLDESAPPLLLPSFSYRQEDVLVESLPEEGLTISFLYDGSRFGLAPQEYSLAVTPQAFLKEIAPARTFGFYEELQMLQKAGLARGGTTDNALVIKDGRPLKNEYRMDRELVRHKILDFLGDLSLCGHQVKGRIRAERSGHFHNTEFVKKMLEVTLWQ